MQLIHTKLIVLKVILFAFYGALGCLMPFLTPQMQELGLNKTEITTISFILPFTALLGPSIVGYIADKLGYYKYITVTSMILAAVFYTILLFVPPTNSPLAGKSLLTLECDQDGSMLKLRSCGYQCTKKFNYQHTEIRIDKCEEVCSEGGVGAEESTVTQPQMCFHHQGSEYQTCQTISQQQPITFNRSIENPYKQLIGQENEICVYPQEDFISNSEFFTNMTCSVSRKSCFIKCDAREMNDTTKIFHIPKCLENRKLTFWLYLLFRSLADMFPSILISLLDAVVLTIIAQHGGDFGRQKMFGFVSVGVFAPIVGYMMDNDIMVRQGYTYTLVFYVFDGLLVITALLCLTLPIKIDTKRTSLMKNVRELIYNKELLLLLLIMIVLGSMYGYLETFIYLRLIELKGSSLLCGLTVTLGILPSVPFLYKSETVVAVCGHHYLLIIAFIFYSIKFAGFAIMTNPWWSLLIEATELFTINMMNIAAVLLTYKLAPTSLVATAQGIVWLAHYNVGRGIGTLIGGTFDKMYGSVVVYQGIAVFSLICSVIYLGLYQTVKYYNTKASYTAPLCKEKHNGEIPNGHYVAVPTSRCETSDERF